MRITVNLSIFFHDHRSLVKIFINKKMKCIRDLENHIGDIFKIKDFYLKCENQYLPPTEDIQIINNDDIIWAVPVEHFATSWKVMTPIHNPVTESEKTPNLITKIKKTKFTYAKCDDFIESEAKMELEESPIVKKKKKKKKRHADKNCDENEELQHVENGFSENITKKPRLTIDSPICAEVKYSSFKDSGYRHSSQDISTIYNDEDGKNLNVKSLVDTFENKKKSFGNLSILNSGNERKINIVKTVVISNKSNEVNKSKSGMDNGKKLDELKQQIVSEIRTSNISAQNEIANVSNKFETPTSLDTTKSLKHNKALEDNACASEDISAQNEIANVSDKFETPTSLDTTKSLENNKAQEDNICTSDDGLKMSEFENYVDTSSNVSYTTVNDFDLNVNKRRRRRTRKKKSKPGNIEYDSPGAHLSYNATYQPPIVQKGNHLRFNDDPITSKEEVRVINESSKTDGVILINESMDGDEPKKLAELSKSPKLANENVTHLIKDTFTDKEIENCILKQPITQNTEPRVGDVIAFKILRISEDYTPEVSSTIVGKVYNYKSRTKEITFDIVYGQDQCLQPRGKFFLEQDEELQQEGNSKFLCVWSSLLEPRLIFP